MPIFRSTTTIGSSRPSIVIGGLNGIIAKAISAVRAEMPGANRKIQRSDPVGRTSSLVNILITSANGCIMPNGPTRFGPWRNCIRASSFRSANTR